MNTEWNRYTMSEQHIIFRRPYYLKQMLRVSLLLLGLGILCTGVSCSAGLCYYCGSYYNEGEKFPTFDLCNSCVCLRDEITGIGRIKCDLSNKCEGYCYSGRKKYSSKSTFLDGGLCAKCDCAPDNVREFDKCGGLVFCLSSKACK